MSCRVFATSSHSGRRTFATRLHANGVGMRTIQKLMGHQHIGATASCLRCVGGRSAKCGGVGLTFWPIWQNKNS
jgi:Phage integrase family